MNEKNFLKELSRVPEVPANLLECIETRIRRNNRFRTTLFAVAATFLLAVGTGSLFLMQSARDRSLSPEVVSELQSIYDYVNGIDIDNGINQYALAINDDAE